MYKTLTFAQCLEHVMQKHKLSASNLALLIGARSDLRHVLTDDANHSKRSKLYARLKESHLFDENDYLDLEHALEVSRLGVERFRFQLAIEEILSGERRYPCPPITTDSGTLLADRFLTLEKAAKIEIICFNCCFYSLFVQLSPLFSDPKRDISMQHYIQCDSSINVAAEYVSVVMPILFDSRYTSFYRPSTIDAKVPTLGGNQLLIRAVIDNRITELFFVFSSDHTAFELHSPELCHMFSFVKKVLKGVSPSPVAIKETSPFNMDFPSLCMTFLSRELNRATYDIGCDPCFQQTPTEIALAAFRDKGFVSEEETSKIINRTLSIHEQRYQNNYRKKKATIRIMTKAGCERFLETGESTDHFIGFRPFTIEERKIIFERMISSAKANASFSPMLLRESTFTHRYNLVCYEKLGVSIDAKDTDYDISNGYKSVFLMLPEFTKQYMEYYSEILMKEKCHNRDQSILLLEEMYERFLEKNHLTI